MNLVPCNLCGDNNTITLTTCTDLHLYLTNERFTLVRCKKCGLIYLNPQPTMEELAPYYPVDYSSYQPEMSVLGENRLLTFLKKFKRSKTEIQKERQTSHDVKTVLDFGYGNGSYLHKLHEHHPQWNLYGFDIGTNENIITSEKNTTLLIGSPELVWQRFPPGTFDLINLSHTLEHVNDPKSTLTHLAPLLRPDGVLVIEVPNIATWKFRVFGRYFSNLDAPRHLYHFSPETLSKMCAEAGLKVMRLETPGTSKSTVRSIYNVLHVHSRTLDPLLYKCVDTFSKLLGDRSVNNDALRVECQLI